MRPDDRAVSTATIFEPVMPFKAQTGRMQTPTDELETWGRKSLREEFDTGLRKIKHEIKSRLAAHGLFGTVTEVDMDPSAQVPAGSTIKIVAKGRAVERTFDRQQIEGCRLRVGGDVLLGVIAMVDDLSTEPSASVSDAVAASAGTAA